MSIVEIVGAQSGEEVGSSEKSTSWEGRGGFDRIFEKNPGLLDLVDSGNRFL
ncbi:hypothetical protein RJF_0687 [Candidozyma auris]|uniref:Uncharacterized protein n=1 Tax=Candidozyma auris TaxID=498019 RepID=A0A0L0NNS4_CANAR|nr:hypothetical protein QG37_08018 [[Candida] auris]